MDTGTIPSKTLREAVMVFSGLTGRADRLPWTRVDSRPTAAQLFTGVDAVIAREVEVVERPPPPWSTPRPLDRVAQTS